MITIINPRSTRRPPYRNRRQPLHTSSCSDIVSPYQFFFSKFCAKLHCPNHQIIIALPHLCQHYREYDNNFSHANTLTLPKPSPTHQHIIVRQELCYQTVSYTPVYFQPWHTIYKIIITKICQLLPLPNLIQRHSTMDPSKPRWGKPCQVGVLMSTPHWPLHRCKLPPKRGNSPHQITGVCCVGSTSVQA